MKAKILTPHGAVFDGDVLGVQMPGVNGGLEVLKNHSPLVALLEVGKLIVRFQDDEDLRFAVSTGFAEVQDNEVMVMVEEAASPDDIDLNHEKERKARIQEELKQQKIDTPEYIHLSKQLDIVKNKIALAQ